MIDYQTKPVVKNNFFVDEKLVLTIENQIINKIKSKPDMSSFIDTTENKYLSSKIFEMNDGAIYENILMIDEEHTTDNFLNFNNLSDKSLIIIINDQFNDYELFELEKKLDKKLHTIVYIGNNKQKIATIFKRITKRICTSSISKAISKSYRIVKNGQSIVLPKIDMNFDFFSHVDFA
ncbi:MAG: hypothetical protein JXR51_03695 [Bacteroidales bacterium]|nr:hypothetical protein [Bacteroidales bacterium]MBN2756257.1 hypothetical protein [Bacteroidales bacterium]